MKKILTFLCFLIFISASAQVNCAVSAGNDTVLCSATDIVIKASGNLQDMQWLSKKGLKISNQAATKQRVDSTTTFYLVNKIPFGTELIKDGGFENGGNFTSDYFASCQSGTMQQGAYCMTDNSGWFHPGWTKCTSRTGSGKILVSDGAVKTNEKIWCQKLAVLPNTDYAFSAWITTLIASNPPIMQFSINGKLLGQAFQANKTPCQWEEFFEIWNSQLYTSAEICIINQNTQGEGNDFALDDISLRETCFYRDSVKIQVIDKIKVDLGTNDSICTGDTKILSNLSSNLVHDLQYSWSSGENSPSIAITKPGKYKVTASTINGCANSDSINFYDIGIPSNHLPLDTTLCFDAHPNVVFRSGYAKKTIWTFGEKIDTSAEYRILSPGIYWLLQKNGENCSLRSEIKVEDKCSYNVFIPNAFTPNNDGHNDTFGAYAFETYSFLLRVYDRWGNKIFESEHLNHQWDGNVNFERAPTGVYVYHLNYSVIDLKTNLLSQKSKTGTISLIR